MILHQLKESILESFKQMNNEVLILFSNFLPFFLSFVCLKLTIHLDKLIGNFLSLLGVLTVIVGKSGSGKFSIVGALLKELQIERGQVEWNK
jgi:hypothetical protein